MNLAQIAKDAVEKMRPRDQRTWVVGDQHPKPTDSDLKRVEKDLLSRNPDLAPVHISRRGRVITIVSQPKSS